MTCNAGLFAVSLLFAIVLQSRKCDAIQFFLEARTKRCFREDVPLNTDVVFTYTIAQGSGAMPVNVMIIDAFARKVGERNEADHGVITFHTPKHIPDGSDGNKWSIRDDDRQDDSDRLYRLYPDAVGDNRLPYFFCFEHPRSLYIPRLSMRDSVVKRRVIFTVTHGLQSRGKKFYDDLAKEKHLSTTEELFHEVEDRVTDIVRLIDEMSQREKHMSQMTEKNSKAVALYSALACLAITIGALYTSYWTLRFLSRDKRVR